MNIQTNLLIDLSTAETLTLGAAASAIVNDQLRTPLSWGNGTGTGLVDLHWEAVGVTLAAGASATYTLSALADSLGRTVAFAKIRAWALIVTSRTAGDGLLVGDPTGALAHAWVAPFDGSATGKMRVWDAEAKAAVADGFAVVSGTSDQLKVKNDGANPITYSVAFVGTSV